MYVFSGKNTTNYTYISQKLFYNVRVLPHSPFSTTMKKTLPFRKSFASAAVLFLICQNPRLGFCRNWHLAVRGTVVAGLHRASPSAALDKVGESVQFL